MEVLLTFESPKTVIVRCLARVLVILSMNSDGPMMFGAGQEWRSAAIGMLGGLETDGWAIMYER